MVKSAFNGAIKDIKKGNFTLGIHLDDFLNQLKSLVGKMPFSKDAIAMYYCMKDSQTPIYAKGIIAAALTYLFLPEDAIPEWVAGLGLTDDMIVMSTALSAISGNISAEHWEKADRFFDT